MSKEGPRGKGKRTLESADTLAAQTSTADSTPDAAGHEKAAHSGSEDATQPGGPLAGEARAAALARAADALPGFQEGTSIGRFKVLREIGAGGMGVVLAARDPELKRNVAIKVLRPDRWMSSSPTEGRQRLLREAQAMAAVSHPNVIPVYDVGTVDDQVFVAMEHVAGVTLTKWLEEQDRTFEQILDVFDQAGRGLAASHDAGLVHRDFKPDNVLVGTDGRVRVTDFGLVSSTGESLQDEDENGGFRVAPTSLGMTLTRTGAIMGTPVYMAPEQHRGDTATEATDQFAFCVALYEALYGERPFSGASYKELAESVLGGAVRDTQDVSGVPTEIRPILLRGLAVDAADRFGSMTELLDALGRLAAAPPARGRAPFLAAAVAGVALVAGGLAVVSGTGDDDNTAPTAASVDVPPIDAGTAALRTEPAPSPVDAASTLSDTIHIRLDIRPRNARVELDGIATTERTLSLPKSNEEHVLVLRANGYATLTHPFRPLASGTLELTLERTRPRTKQSRSRPRPAAFTPDASVPRAKPTPKKPVRGTRIDHL